ncbi:hypothetical protein D9V86_09860 [Bacteroidetes/Chlorobi group bacterium ChocPot_Mid]|nr:MAG: hypothetical protein D9V86_09860 [Bacteroidetes/Chlorobi group bacterium ChocPot_Mid]
MTDKQKLFIEIFRKNAGNIAVTCRKLNISRDTYYEWYNKQQKIETDNEGNEIKIPNEFKVAADEVKESTIDFTESALLKKISGITTKTIKIKEVLNKEGNIVRLKEETIITHPPDIVAIIFLLKTLGRKRGWKETTDMKIETDGEGKLTSEQISELEKLTTEEKKDLITLMKKVIDN